MAGPDVEEAPETVPAEFASPAALGLPAKSVRTPDLLAPGATATKTASTTQTEDTPAMQEARAQAAQGTEEEIAALRAQGKQNAAAATIKVAEAEELAKFDADRVAAREAKLAAHENAIKNETAQWTKAREQFSKADIHDFWEDKSLGYKVQARIALALGAFGSSLSGGQNAALSIMNSQIDHDFAKQKLTIEKMKDNVAMRLAGVENAEKARDKLQAVLLAKETAARQMIADKYAAGLAKLGVPAAQIEADLKVGQLRQKAAEPALKAAEMISKKVTEGETRGTTTPALVRETTENTAKPDDNKAEAGVLYGPGGKPLVDAKGQTIRIPGPSKSAESIAEKTARPAVQAYSQLRQEIGKLKVLAGKAEGSLGELIGDDANKRDVLTTNIVSTISTMGNTGVLNAGEFERYKGMLGNNPSAVIMGWSKAKLDEVMHDLQVKLQTKMDSIGAPGAVIMKQLDAAPTPGQGRKVVLPSGKRATLIPTEDGKGFEVHEE